jgi:hypothetical protein
LQEQVKIPCGEEALKRNNVALMISSMNNSELDYVIDVIKGIRKINLKPIT